jgi:hypothetical protein
MPATVARLVISGPRIAAPVSGQKGIVLLASMFLLVIGASFVLVRKLNVAATSSYRDQQTAYVLSQAKQALIGRSVADDNRPGSLPCPDLITNIPGTNVPNDGIADLFAGNACPSYVGRLPWRTLGLPEFMDASDERLWYAISQNFRDHPVVQPINSDTLGQLTLDGAVDIVAVIIAPGTSFSGQNRPSNSDDDYLEADNNNDDTVFVSQAAGNFNDHVIAITRQELMATVEKRIVGEVAQTLAIYQNNYAANAYPWLSPFDSPFLSVFDGVVDTWEGHLPIHTNNELFPTAFSATWAVTGGTTTPAGGLPPDENCVRSDTCVDAVYGPIAGPIVGSTCRWTNGNPPPPTYGKDALNCSATLNLVGGVTRRYQFLYTTVGVAATIVAPPNGSATRTREFHLASPFPPQVAAITVIDRDNSETELGRRTLDVDGTSTGNIDITGIQYDLDTNTYATVPTGPEIPPWFVANNWHHLIYVAYPTVEDPPGSAAVCVPGTDCLTLNGVDTPIDNKRALVISAGSDLDVTTPRPNNVLAEYLEGENSSPAGNGVFARQQPLNGVFNDQVRVVRTSP